MKNNSVKILLTAIVIVAFGCTTSQPKVSTNYDQEIDFSKFATFKILENNMTEDLPSQQSKESSNYINDKVTAQLESAGLLVSETPDLLVNIDVMVQSKEQKRERTFQDGPYYTGQRHYGWSASDSIKVGYYKEGTLTVDLIEKSKNQIVWSGVAKGIISDDWKEEKSEIDKAIVNMFASYPPDPEEKAGSDL